MSPRRGWRTSSQGRNLKTGEIVAIKIVSLDETDQGLDSIRKEISVLKECNHPNIVRYYGSYFKDDYLWVRAPASPLRIPRGRYRRECPHTRRPRRAAATDGAVVYTQIVMEYCGGGAVKDIVQILEKPLREDQIAFVCREALKVRAAEADRSRVRIGV